MCTLVEFIHTQNVLLGSVYVLTRPPTFHYCSNCWQLLGTNCGHASSWSGQNKHKTAVFFASPTTGFSSDVARLTRNLNRQWYRQGCFTNSHLQIDRLLLSTQIQVKLITLDKAYGHVLDGNQAANCCIDNGINIHSIQAVFLLQPLNRSNSSAATRTCSNGVKSVQISINWRSTRALSPVIVTTLWTKISLLSIGYTNFIVVKLIHSGKKSITGRLSRLTLSSLSDSRGQLLGSTSLRCIVFDQS